MNENLLATFQNSKGHRWYANAWLNCLDYDAIIGKNESKL